MKHKLLTGSLSFTVGMGFSALPAVAQQSPASTEVKPNVIIINVDDLGYGDIGCYGATKVKTPNIDRLASQGRSFTRRGCGPHRKASVWYSPKEACRDCRCPG